MTAATTQPTTIFDRSQPKRSTSDLPRWSDFDGGGEHKVQLPPELVRRQHPRLPDVDEPTLVRHYVQLSQRNYNIDTGMYPLGSCTMKYNPKINDEIAALPGFARLHPLQGAGDVQGMMQVLDELQVALRALSGLPHVSLVPAAGAHGELAGLMMMGAWHEGQVAAGTKSAMPTHVIIPDTAHGTNPASVTMAGFETISVPTTPEGGMDVEAVRAACQDHAIVGLMLTNPNTLGVFDRNVTTIAQIVHDAGGLLYYDGANLNAIMGRARPGDMGFDIVHFNVHKSLSTPHGGGGPGAGPIAVRADLAEFLPDPIIARHSDGSLELQTPERSVGRLRQFWGNAGVLVRAWVYVTMLGNEGLRATSDAAVLNANYILHGISDIVDAPYGNRCMHEFVVSLKKTRKEHSVRAIDVAKRLMDYGFHPPTMYFPLLVDEALMVEPTETETRETLDQFIAAFRAVVAEASDSSEIVQGAPHSTSVGRLNETEAARSLIVTA